ncbi:hypothetical protein G4B88_006832 [Cannabis sativa]|uniref:RING-type domain-containing protein n=1 Tax=Cannabis sativa TaxID=3483 RepID=A0A7J6DWX8_CANSA|nr:hypothetical protein G4B88_006832 [Cannabis sativa]
MDESMEYYSPSPSPFPFPFPIPSFDSDSDYDLQRMVTRWFLLALFVAVLVLAVFASTVNCSRPRRVCRASRSSHPRPPPLEMAHIFPPPELPPVNDTDNVVAITCTYRIEKPKSPISSDEKNNDGGFDCAICFENFEYGVECKLFVECNHGFHKACIDEWLSCHNHCPLCRGTVRPGHTTNLDRFVYIIRGTQAYRLLFSVFIIWCTSFTKKSN